MMPHTLWILTAGCVLCCACGGSKETPSPAHPASPQASARPTSTPAQTAAKEEASGPRDTRPAPAGSEAAVWEKGKQVASLDAKRALDEGYLLVDIGEAWTPYLFSERASESETRMPNAYRKTFLALARGAYPKDHHGDRARKDKYLELYGIPPTLQLLRRRFQAVKQKDCGPSIDLAPLEAYEGFAAYRGMQKAKAESKRYLLLKRGVDALLKRQKVNTREELDRGRVAKKDLAKLQQFEELAPRVEAISAAQRRLICEGYLPKKGFTPGGLDWVTHQGLAEFERRHRIYGWGHLNKDSLRLLRLPPLELEREALLRVLSERALLDAGAIEDGSTMYRAKGQVRTYKGADGNDHPMVNLEAAFREALTQALGLTDPEAALAWLEGLGELPKDRPRYLAFRGPALPEYYSANMELSVVIDRGDVWYEFPFDEKGQKRAQPIRARPSLTLVTTYRGQRIPLARYGTTIGGWRSELVNGAVMWKYKNSPIGPRVWHEIVAAPVWIPPDSTPDEGLLQRVPGKRGAEKWEVDYHEIGPSYASAYGLAAAYHLRFDTKEDGSLELRGDEGIRTHGSVDYMSIRRRNSHGCHRLHNHIAIRLMSFVLAHRTHRRIGQQRVNYVRDVETEGFRYHVAVKQGGYLFELETPLPVNVLKGNIKGDRKTPILNPLPKFEPSAGAFVHPEGGKVAVDKMGRVRSAPPEEPGGAESEGAEEGPP